MESIQENSLIITRDKLVQDGMSCCNCDEGTLVPDTLRSFKANQVEQAIRRNKLNFARFKPLVIFHCANCDSEFETSEIQNRLVKLVKPQEDLRPLAKACNPEVGQPWILKSGFPSEICPINKRPCFQELWKVCPHIGNDTFTDIVNAPGITIVGE